MQRARHGQPGKTLAERLSNLAGLGKTSRGKGESHLAELHVSWLPIAKLATFPPIPVTCHKVQTGADILQLQPVKELQGSGGAGPVQNSPQLIDEGQSAEDLQA